MQGFTKRELIGSLFCPALTILWGGVRFLVDLTCGLKFTGEGSFRLTAIFAVFIGGILPVILTLTHKIHTEQYLKKRIITIIAVYVANGFIGLFGNGVTMLALYMIVGIGAVLFQILKIQDENTLGKERVVLILSDPIVYWTIYWFIFWFTEFLEI